MNRTILTTTLSLVVALATTTAWAEDRRFSLSDGFDNSTNNYETGPWVFKLNTPVGLSTGDSSGLHAGPFGPTDGTTNFSDTEATASYNLHAGSASTPEVNLTGKIKVNLADKNSAFGLTHNDYAAQMDVYQNLYKFTAKGTLGSKVLGSPTGLILTPTLYGSFGGIYQLTSQTSTGVDMSLSQDPYTAGAVQQELSAFVNYKLDKNFKARGYVLRGTSNGTQNNTVGGQVYYGF